MIGENQESQLDGPLIAGFTKHYWTFLFAENLYDIGLYIFVLLYNLYLLDLGYREDFLGWVTSAMSAGGIVACLPAAGIVKKLGLKRTVIGGSAGVAMLCILRTAALGRPWLIGTAFVAGALSSVWAVSLVPIVVRQNSVGAGPDVNFTYRQVSVGFRHRARLLSIVPEQRENAVCHP